MKNLTPDKIALTSTITDKTFEDLPRDNYPNSFIPYTEEEIVAGQPGGRLWCDWIPRPQKKIRTKRRQNLPS